MPPRPYVLAESNWKSVKDTPFEVAILPWGATEPHNYHLPYGTDNYETGAIAERAAEIAWKQGAKVVVLPTVPFGVNTGQLDLRLALNMNPSTQLALLTDIASAIAGQGVRKLLILNGHGGNDFRQMIRELQPRVKLFICTINWWTCVSGAGLLRRAGRPRRRDGDERDDGAPARRVAPVIGSGRTGKGKEVPRRRPARRLGVGATTVVESHERHRHRKSRAIDRGEG